ncbi:hypothetical protein RJ639_016190 [Escallonia herrerae]|uniref:DUF7788 domain-containing protein n=1 Tax=Escallonia herrerae TaxID=1293975 RepID=A0AA88VE08_9ASTE|nr:hypothetical protein RJ639_016190 [Escallonia herrerae]
MDLVLTVFVSDLSGPRLMPPPSPPSRPAPSSSRSTSPSPPSSPPSDRSTRGLPPSSNSASPSLPSSRPTSTRPSPIGAPLEVSVAVGLLISELSEEPWKGKLITFGEKPRLISVEEYKNLVVLD